jgi:ABC-type multidrug transport system fused ATPase/permease subunit
MKKELEKLGSTGKPGLKLVAQTARVLGKVSLSLWRLLWEACGRQLSWLTLLVLAGACLPYARWAIFGKLLDNLSAAKDYHYAMWLFFGLIGLVQLVDKLTQKVTYDVDLRCRQFFIAYFPAIRLKFGLESFQRSSKLYQMLSRAEDGEYHSRFFITQQIILVGAALNAIVGAGVIAWNAPVVGAFLAVAVLCTLCVQASCAMKLTLKERSLWSAVAESTSIKHFYHYKERMKSILLFGIAPSLIEHLKVLGSRIFPAQRELNNKLFPAEIGAAAILTGAYALSIWWLVRETEAHTISVGKFSYLVATLLSLGLTLVRIVEGLANQARGADKIVDLMECLEADKPNPQKLGGSGEPKFTQAPEVRAEGLTFGYEPQKLVLRNVSFTIPSGEITWVVGHNGAGKTTLFNQISQLYPVNKAQLFIGGEDVSALDPDKLRSVVRHLGQESIQFRFTIRQSLAFVAGYGANPGQCPETIMWQALKLACLDHKVRSFRRGLDEPLAAYESAEEDLSGGQTRKSNIAMFFMAILCGHTKCLVLDEPFVGIDPMSSATILENLRSQDATVILSTHGVERIPLEDRVLFLCREDNGSQNETRVFQGTHGELLERSPEYARYCALFGAQAVSSVREMPLQVNA